MVEAPVPLASSANGITAGADGNVYVVETFNQSVAVLSPAGQLIRRVSLAGVAGTATNAALGPDGRVWVAISTTGAGRGFQRIETSGNVVGLSTAQTCGPVGMAVWSPTRMLFTTPDPTFACGGSSGLGAVNGDGTALQSVAAASAYDVAVTGGKAIVPDYDGNVVRRYALSGAGVWPPANAPEATWPIPVAAGADGIEVGPGNQLYVTMYNSGDVIRIDPAASSGFNTKMVASGLTNPYGMAMGADGALYVASQDARLLRIAPDGSQRFIALPAGFAAFQVARAGNDIWATDANNARVIRIRNAGLPEPPAARHHAAGDDPARHAGARRDPARDDQAGRQAEGRLQGEAGGQADRRHDADRDAHLQDLRPEEEALSQGGGRLWRPSRSTATLPRVGQ